jgi:hypothetical protein
MSDHPAFKAMKEAWLANDAKAKEASNAAEQALLEAQKHTQEANEAREAMFQLEQHAAKHGWMFFNKEEPERGGKT